MPVLASISLTILTIVFLTVVFLAIISKLSVSAEKAGNRIKNAFMKMMRRHSPPAGLVYIHRTSDNMVLALSRNEFGHSSEDIEEVKLQPFHIASVGKLFTSTLTFSLMEQQLCALDSRIINILEPELLRGLFVYEGVDYAPEVTVEHLLSHTSGVADYFSEAGKNGDSLQNTLLQKPHTSYTPLELLDISRQQQQALFPPGMGYHYSDTGYILLGLVIEKLSGKEFHEVLDERIFAPLGMNHSYLATHCPHPPEKNISAPIYVGGLDLRNLPALSADWSGGGVISTAGDLETFIRGLFAGEIIGKESLSEMMREKNTFVRGIQYATGMMKIRFGDFFPLLASMNHMYGHMGVLGTQLFWDPREETVYISNFSSDGFAERSVRFLISAMSVISRTGRNSH